MRKGFTLIEMLISMVIFSFLIALAAYSFRFYANVAKKVVMPYPQKAENFSKLEDTLRSIFYFTGERINGFGKISFFTYFYGNSENMTFITSKSINCNKGIYICKLYVDNKTLILEESPVYSQYNDYKNPYLTKKSRNRISLMKNISKIKFLYYVNGSKTEQLTQEIPSLIEIQIEQNNKILQLYFKIQSDFTSKKNLMRLFYAPF